MGNRVVAPHAFDLNRVKAELQSTAYRERVAEAMRDVKSLQEKAVVDKAKLFIPIDF